MRLSESSVSGAGAFDAGAGAAVCCCAAVHETVASTARATIEIRIISRIPEEGAHTEKRSNGGMLVSVSPLLRMTMQYPSLPRIPAVEHAHDRVLGRLPGREHAAAGAGDGAGAGAA